jgi:hypothetical protein
MTSTRYALTSEPYGKLTDYVQAAIAAITAIAGRPLESLDAIPENLRHLFREETVMTVQAAGAVKTGQAVYACPICSLPMTDTDGGCVRHDPWEIAAWNSPAAPAEDKYPDSLLDELLSYISDRGWRDTSVSARVCTINLANDLLAGKLPGLPSPDDFAKVKAERDTFRELRDALKAEVQQRIRERDHYSEQSDRWIAEVKQLKAEIAALRLKCGEF